MNRLRPLFVSLLAGSLLVACVAPSHASGGETLIIPSVQLTAGVYDVSPYIGEHTLSAVEESDPSYGICAPMEGESLVVLIKQGTCILEVNGGSFEYQDHEYEYIQFNINSFDPYSGSLVPPYNYINKSIIVDGGVTSTVDHGTCTVTSISQASPGSVALVGGEIKYTPPTTYKGPDAFNYACKDGTAQPQLVFVSVTVRNQAPVIVGVSRTVDPGTVVSLPVVASDPNNDQITLSAGTASPLLVTNLSGTTLQFSVPVSFTGTSTVPVTVTDSEGAKASANFSVTVGLAPVVSGQATVTASKRPLALNQISMVKSQVSLLLPEGVQGIEIQVNGAVALSQQSVSSNSPTFPVSFAPGDKVEAFTTALINGNPVKSAGLVLPVSGSLLPIANVNFATGSSVLTDAAKQILDGVIAELQARGYKSVSVVGHTDSAGGTSNMALAQARAAAVEMYLQNNGVTLSISTNAVADRIPVGSNSSSSGMALNRRVEVFVS